MRFFVKILILKSENLIIWDAVLVEISDQGRKAQVIATHTEPIESTLREKIRTVSSGEDDCINTVHALDTALAEQFANAANQVAEKATRREDIAVIGSHGQTVRHRPAGPFPFSLQLGSGALIAARTGITTIADFRSGDMAVGGQGAPLTVRMAGLRALIREARTPLCAFLQRHLEG